MTGLIAGYATAFAAFLVAATTAFTIVYSVNRLPDTDDVALPTEETARKAAA